MRGWGKVLDMPANENAVRELRMTPELSRVLDIGERIFAVLLAAPFLWAFARALPLHPTYIFIAITEMLSVFFILVRRGGLMASTPYAIVVAFAGSGFALLARPEGTALVPTAVSTTLMIGGLALSILSKLYLNRSFGLVAANRGVKMKGPYRFVRHPMYLGYIIDQLGFLLASFSLVNLLVYVSTWTFQVLRIAQEEKILRQDPSYRQFTDRVPARLVPGLY